MLKIAHILSSVAPYLRLNLEPAFMKKIVSYMGGSMVAPLSIQEVEKEGIYILRVGGRLDNTSAPLFEKKLNSIIEISRAKVIIDCAELKYLASIGIRIMLAAFKSLKKTEGIMVLSSMNGFPLEVLKGSGLDLHFTLYPSETLALKAIKTSTDKE
jgi:anti-sigma B factor antagonist